MGGSSNSCDSNAPTNAWSSQEKAVMIFAASQLAKYPLYMSKLKCSSSPIPLYRVKKDYGGGCFQDGGIYIYNAGVIHGSSVYTLAHESGHVLQYRNGSYYQLFLSKGISSPLPPGEGLLPTYPGKQKIQKILPKQLVYLSGILTTTLQSGAHIQNTHQHFRGMKNLHNV